MLNIVAKGGAGMHFFVYQYMKSIVPNNDLHKYVSNIPEINEYVVENTSYQYVYPYHFKDVHDTPLDKLNTKDNYLAIRTTDIQPMYFQMLSKLKQGFRPLNHKRTLYDTKPHWYGFVPKDLPKYQNKINELEKMCKPHGLTVGSIGVSFIISNQDLTVDNYKKYVIEHCMSFNDYKSEELPNNITNLQIVEYMDLINGQDLGFMSNINFQEYHLKNMLFMEKYSMLLDYDLTKFIP